MQGLNGYKNIEIGEENIMIKIEGLTKKLEDFSLQDITLELPKGYIMGLVGENGAVKTTLLNLILGIYIVRHRKNKKI